MTVTRYDIEVKDVIRVPGVKVIFGVCEHGSDVEYEGRVILGDIRDDEIMEKLKVYVRENIDEICIDSVVGETDYIEVDDEDDQ